MSTGDQAEFDAFAEDYDTALNGGLSLTGEDKNFYALGRLRWLARQLENSGHQVSSCLDFGCGTGSATGFLHEQFTPELVVGIDPSEPSLEVARESHAGIPARFENTATFAARDEFDLAYCNGVYHHIPPEDRAAATAQVFAALRPGSYFSLWENNPWNPATRFVMSRVPFDKDAILLWPAETRRMLRGAGFEIISTEFAFIFPGPLRKLRFLEHPLRKLPFGGQYQVLARKPEEHA